MADHKRVLQLFILCVALGLSCATTEAQSGDTTPPVPGTVTVTSAQFGSFVSNSVSLSTSFTDNESAITGCEYTTDGVTWLAATVSGTGPTVTCTQAGITGSNGQVLALNMRATSSGGTGAATAVTRTVDAAAPTTTSNAPTTWVRSNQSITLTPSDGSGAGVASTQYCTDTTNSCTPATSGTFVTVSCGIGSACQTYVRYRSTDQVGNVETTRSALVLIDKGLPSVSITTPTTSSTWSATASPLALGGTGSDNVGVTSVSWSNAATGGSGTASGTTSWSASVPLVAGSNVITVTARDAANNAASVSITVSYTAGGDTTPPVPGTVTVTSVQSGSFVSSSVSLSTSFTDNESAITGCQYTTDGVTWLAATVSGTGPTVTCTQAGITGSNGQVLALNMRATSSGGTGTATAITRTVDATAPTTTSNAATAWVASDQTVTLTPGDGSGAGVASTQYCTDTTNSCTPATAGTSVTVTCAAGSACQTYVRYRSTDQVGNVEAIESALVRIDKGLPAVAITTPTTGSTWSATASPLTLSGTGSDNVGVTSVTWSNAATGGSGTASGTTSWSASVPLVAGSNVVTVTARDAANNTATATLTVSYAAGDTTPPIPGTVTVTSVQSGSFVSSSVSLSTSFTDNESAITGCQYTTDGVTWVAASVSGTGSTITCTKTGITGSSGQVLTLNMRATSSGGTGAATAITRTVDATAPTTTSNAATTWVASDQTVTLTPGDGSGAGVASTQYCTDTTNSCTPATSGTSVTVTCAAGSACQTYVRYRSTDQVGNVEATNSALVRIDKGLPAVAITTPTTGSTWSATASPLALSGTGSDNVGVTSVTWSNGATGGSGTASGTTSWSASVPLVAGSNAITVTAKDAANNTATATLTVSYTAPDTTPPVPGTVTVTSVQSGSFVSSSVSLSTSFTDNESAITGCQYTTDGVTWVTATVSGTGPTVTCTQAGVTGTSGQVLTLNMRATSSGGTGTATAITRTVDATAPTTTSNAATTWVASDQTVTLTPGDGSGAGVASTQYCTDTTNSCTPATAGTSVAVTCTAGTTCQTYVRYRSTDQVGNVEATNSALVRIDKAAPTNGALTATPGNTQVTLSWSGFSDSGSGLSSAPYTLFSSTGGVPASCTGTPVYSGSATTYTQTGLTNGTPYYFRVCATDNVGLTDSGATASATPASSGADTTPPAGSLAINGNSAYTNSITVTLNLSATDNVGVTAYWLSLSQTTPSPTAVGWTAVTSTKSFTANVSYTFAFTADGKKTVYAWYMDAAGNVSAMASASIYLDRTAPANGTLTATPGIGLVTLSWSGFADYGSGLSGTPYTLVYSTVSAPASCASGTPLFTGSATTFTQNNATSGLLYYYRVCATDQAGNIDTGATASAVPLANQPPVAKAGPDQTGAVGTAIYFDASGSYDSDGTIVSYTFSFGDGLNISSDNGSVVSHTYSATGTYTMTLTVTDNLGATSSDTALVKVVNATAAQGNFRSVRILGGPGNDYGNAVAVDGSGNPVVVGSFQGTVDFGGGPLTSAGLADIFIARYSSAGVCSLQVGGSGDDRAEAVAVDPSNNIVVTGSFQGTVDFGGKILTSNGGADVFVAKYGSTCVGGKFPLLWARSFGSSLDDVGYGVAVDLYGDVVVTGYFQGSADFGGGLVLSDGPFADVFVAKYAGSTGAYVWAHTLYGTGLDYGQAIAVDGDANVVVAGTFQSTVADGTTFTPLMTSAGNDDVFLIKYSRAGTYLWSRALGGSGDDIGYGVAVDSGGNIALVGSFGGTVDFGGGPLTSAGLTDIFVAKYSPMGNHLWSRSIGGTGSDAGYAVAVDGTGNVVMTGVFQNTVSVGTGTLTSAGQWDILVAKYSANGVPLWSKSFGSPVNDVGSAVAVDGTGNVYTTGYFQGTVNFGSGPLTSAGGADAFLLSFTP